VHPFFNDCVDLFSDSYDICNVQKRGAEQTGSPLELSFSLHSFSRTIAFYSQELEDSSKSEGSSFALLKKKVLTDMGIKIELSFPLDSSCVQSGVLNMLYIIFSVKEAGGAIQLMQGTVRFQQFCHLLCQFIEDHENLLTPAIRSHCVQLSLEIVTHSTLTEWKQHFFSSAVEALRHGLVRNTDTTSRQDQTFEASIATLIQNVLGLEDHEKTALLSHVWGSLSEVLRQYFEKECPSRSLCSVLCQVFVFGVNHGFLEAHLQYLMPLFKSFQQSTYFQSERSEIECNGNSEGGDALFPRVRCASEVRVRFEFVRCIQAVIRSNKKIVMASFVRIVEDVFTEDRQGEQVRSKLFGNAERFNENAKRRLKLSEPIVEIKKEKRRKTLQFDDFPLEDEDKSCAEEVVEVHSSMSAYALDDIGIVEGFVQAICRVYNSTEDIYDLAKGDRNSNFGRILRENPILVVSLFLQSFAPFLEECPSNAVNQWISFINSNFFEKTMDSHPAISTLVKDGEDANTVTNDACIWNDLNCIVDSLLFQTIYFLDSKKLQSMSTLIARCMKLGAHIIAREQLTSFGFDTSYGLVAPKGSCAHYTMMHSWNQKKDVEFVLFEEEAVNAASRPLLSRIFVLAMFACHPRGVCCLNGNNLLVDEVVELFENGPLSELIETERGHVDFTFVQDIKCGGGGAGAREHVSAVRKQIMVSCWMLTLSIASKTAAHVFNGLALLPLFVASVAQLHIQNELTGGDRSRNEFLLSMTSALEPCLRHLIHAHHERTAEISSHLLAAVTSTVQGILKLASVSGYRFVDDAHSFPFFRWYENGRIGSSVKFEDCHERCQGYLNCYRDVWILLLESDLPQSKICAVSLTYLLLWHALAHQDHQFNSDTEDMMEEVSSTPPNTELWRCRHEVVCVSPYTSTIFPTLISCRWKETKKKTPVLLLVFSRRSSATSR
jgi:hypothetical protein